MDNLIKEEWINQEMMVSPRAGYNHMEIQYSIGIKLKDYFEKTSKVGIETSLFLTNENPAEIKRDSLRLKELVSGKKAELVPDIAVYNKEQIFAKGFLGIPELVVEILSPNNSTDDTETKKVLYRVFGVLEYWIVSPEVKKAYVYNLEDNNYTLNGEYKFLEKEIKSSRFKDLIVDIRNIELIEDEDTL